MCCKKTTSHTLFLIFLLLSSLSCLGQFISAEIGINGLTCSVCTRSVEMSVRKLDFIDSVSMDLSNTSGKVFFKEGSKVVIEEIAKAVTDAGFSVRYLYANFNFKDLPPIEAPCWSYRNERYQLVQTESKQLSGNRKLKFIGEKYLSKKESKDWSTALRQVNGCNGEINYYVTL